MRIIYIYVYYCQNPLVTSEKFFYTDDNRAKYSEEPVSQKDVYMNFEQLVKKAQAGNTKEMEVIINAFRPLVMKLKYREGYACIRDEIEGIAQCAIIELVHKYRGPDYICFPGYIKKMLTFTLNNFCRKQQTIMKYEAVRLDTEFENSSSSGSEEEKYAMRTALVRALQKLSPREKRIICSYYWEDKSDSTIAKDMQLSRNTVNTLRQKALTRLKQALS